MTKQYQNSTEEKEIDSVTVSVVIPFSEEFTPREMLEEAKKCVSEQTVDTELIVVEGGTPAENRNTGLEEAETRYVAFLDADDLWSSDKLERQIKKMKKTGAGLCVEGEPPLTADSFIQGLLIGSLSSLTSSIVIDTTQVTTRFDEEVVRFEDHLFLIETAIEAGVCAVPDIVEIRKHEEGLSSSGSLTQLYEARLAVADRLEGKPEVRPYLPEYRHLAYYAYGRGRQLNGKYRAALPYLIKSLQFKIGKRAIGAILLSPVLAIQDTIRRMR